MAVPINNAGLKDIQTEFGGDTTDGGISLTEYYKNGEYVPAGQLPSKFSIGLIPTALTGPFDPNHPIPYPQISIGNFLGLEKLLPIKITITENLLSGFNLRSYITSKYPTWDGKTPVKVEVTISGNVYIIGQTTSSYAFDASGPFPAKSQLKIINNGVISGRGGTGGTGAKYPDIDATPGGDGGHGINASGIETTILNYGLIAGGGGGGGGGASSFTAGYSPSQIGEVGGGGDSVEGYETGIPGAGGVPLGAGGQSLGRINLPDPIPDYNSGNKILFSKSYFEVQSAGLSSRNNSVKTIKEEFGWSYPANGTKYGTMSRTSGEGGDFGMEGFPSERKLEYNYSNGGTGEYSFVVVAGSPKLGGARGKAVVGGNKIIWEAYGGIRGDVDDWGYFESKTTQPQRVRDLMPTPAYYISQTKKVAGWANYGEYYPATSAIDNGQIFPASNGDKSYKCYFTSAGGVAFLEGICDDKLTYMAVNGTPTNFTLLSRGNDGVWSSRFVGTAPSMVMYEYAYRTTTFGLPAGISVIEIRIKHTNNTPHMFNFVVKNTYNAILCNALLWFKA